MLDIKPELGGGVVFAVSLPTIKGIYATSHTAGNRPVVGRSFPETEAGQAAAMRWRPKPTEGDTAIYFNAQRSEAIAQGT